MTDTITPQRFDAPLLDADDTIRIIARHDALSQRRRFDAGFQEGRSEGFAKGAAEAEGAIDDHRRSAERLTALGNTLEQALHQLQAANHADTAVLEDGIVDIALRIAEAVIDREITDHALVVDSVRRSLQLSGRERAVEIRVHPDELGCLDEAIAAGLITLPANAELVADAAITRGGCIVDAGDTRIDAQVDSALERVRAALTTG